MSRSSFREIVLAILLVLLAVTWGVDRYRLSAQIERLKSPREPVPEAAMAMPSTQPDIYTKEDMRAIRLAWEQHWFGDGTSQSERESGVVTASGKNGRTIKILYDPLPASSPP